MQTIILLTGATGVVGSQVLRELVAEGCKVFCIIRAKDQTSAEHRLRQITSHPSAMAIVGDIRRPGCDINLSLIPRIDKVVHSAADVRFDAKHAVEIHETNVIGTENVLGLAKLLRAAEFHYVSTAYVAGTADLLDEQPIDERPLEGLGKPRNPYEASKARAEALVRGWGGRTSVYRPSIVIGNSITGETSGTDGYYGFFKRAWYYSQNGRSSLPVVLKAEESVLLNLVPVDWVGKLMSKLVMLPARGETYNLVHPEPMTVADVIHASLSTLGVTDMSIATELPNKVDDTKVAAMQRAFNSDLRRYEPYVMSTPKWIALNARHILGEEYPLPPAVTPELLQRTLRSAVALWDEERSTNGGNVVRLAHA